MPVRSNIYAFIRSLSTFLILAFFIVSVFTCSDNDVIEPQQAKYAPAKLEIMMLPKASISDITSVKLIVSGPDMGSIETELSINKVLGKASGLINVSIGNDRLFRVEVYVGKFLRYVGEQKVNVQQALAIKIPVGIKPAEGIGVIGVSEQINGKGLVLAFGDFNIFLSKSPGNLKLIQNLAGYLGTAPKLKFDLSLGSTLPQDKIQALEDALRGGGFQVTQDESSNYDRASFDAIFICLPLKNPSTNQVNSLMSFVRNGGMLILVGGADENLDPLNFIANNFGLNFDYALINVPGGNPASLTLSNLATLPLFDGVGAIQTSYARSLSVKSGISDMNTYNGATPGAGAITTPDLPKLLLNPSEVDLGTILQSGQVDVENTGTGTLSWNVSTDEPLPSWLKVTPDNGKLTSGQKRNISVDVDRYGLSPGEYRHTVVINSSAGDGRLSVIMSVPEPEPSLSVSPSSVDFGTTDTQKTVTITNNGGGTLTWQASKQQAWLSLSSTSGSVSSGKSETIILTVNRANQNPGSYRDTVSITSDGGNGSVAVTMTVPEPAPSLSVSPASIDFGTAKTEGTFTITNKGGGTLTWKASKQQAWLSLSSANGLLTSGKSEIVTLTVSRADLQPGAYKDTVSITSDGGNGNVAVAMTVPEPAPSLSVTPLSVDFGTTDTQKTVTISNNGGGTLTWKASKQQAWLTASLTSGSLTSGKSATVTLTVSRADLQPGSYKDTVSVTSDGGNGNVAVTMTVPEPSLSVTPSSIDFGIAKTEDTFTITNKGGGTLTWQASKQQVWLSLSSASGSLTLGKSDTITVKVDRANLKPGAYKDTISVTSDGGSGSVAVTLTMPEPAPSLSISPASVDFGATKTEETFTITNKGGGTLTWKASKQEAWLTVSLTSGSLTSDKSETVTLTVSRADLQPGAYKDTVSITSDGGSGNVAVTMTVPEPAPSLSVTPLSVDFGTTDTQKTVTVGNKGGGTLTWQASKQQAWLTFSLSNGSLSSGKSESMSLTVDRANLKPGSYRDVLSITSDGGNENVSITMTVPEPGPSLSVTPISVDFGTIDTQKTVMISNNGGGTLTWQASKQQAWLTVSPTSGSLTSGKSATVTLTVSRTNLNSGAYKDTVSITSDGGNGNVAVAMTVPEPGPSLSFSPSSLDFGTTGAQNTLTITNKGGGTLAWQASKKEAWLSLSSVSGSLTSGKSDTITVKVDRTGLKPGSYRDVISLTSNGGKGDVTVTMTVPEPPPALSFSPSSLDFGTTDTGRELTITNSGGGTLTWQVSKKEAWLSMSPESGSLASDKSTTLTIKVNRADLKPGAYKDTISLTSNDKNGSIAVTMSVALTTPILSLTPTSLDFGTTDTQKSLTITNTGGGTLTWQLTRQQSWLTLSPVVGSLDSGKSATVSATISRIRLTSGIYKDTISIASNAGNKSIPVTMTVPEPSPALSLSPKPLDFGSDSTQLTLTVTNSGGGTLNWQASSKETWISLSAKSGSLGNGKSINVTVTANRSAIKPGSYSGSIALTSNGGNDSVPVSLLMPGLAFTPSSLNFGISDTQKTLTISNTGAGTLTWKASKKEAWLALSSTGSSLPAGTSINVTVTVSKADLKPFAYSDTIALTSNGGNGNVPVTMPIPGLSFTPVALNFGATDTLTLKISNTGGGTLNWQASKKQTWLALSPASGALSAGASADVTVTVSKTGLVPGSYSDVISLTSDGGSGTVSVSMPIAGFVVSPTSLDFGSIDTQKSVTISNNGGGGPLTWQASKKEAWLTVNPTNGTVEAGRSANVTVTVSRAGVKPGSYSDTIVMTSNSGERRVAVTMDMPGLSFSPASFNFGTTVTQGRLTITNTGKGNLSWSASKTQAWLSLSPASGFISPGSSTVVVITASRNDVAPGTQTDTISLKTNGGDGSVPVTILVPGLSFSPASLDFGAGETQKNLTISNIGAGTLTWQVSKQQEWLTLNPTSGSVDEGKSATVTAIISTVLAPGTYTDTIALTSNGGSGNIPVSVAIPGLAFSPEALSFGSSDTQKILTISNSGGGTLTWRASKQQAWLALNPALGSVGAGKSVNVTATVSKAGLKPGIYTDTIALTTNGGNGEVPVTMGIPGLSFTPAKIDFGTSETKGTLTISNSGGGILTWSATKQQAWLTLSPTSGTVDAGKSVNVNVAVLRTGLQPDSYRDVINLTSDGGFGGIEVVMTVPAPTLSVSPLSLNFGARTTNMTFDISNSGGGTLNWRIDTGKLPAWLSVNPASGSTVYGTPSTVTVTVSRQNLDSTIYQGSIPIIATNNQSAFVQVTMTVLNPLLFILKNALNYGTDVAQDSFVVNNNGGGSLDWSIIQNLPGWLSIEPMSDSTTPESPSEVVITVDRRIMDPGNYSHNVEVTSNYGIKTIPISMTVPGPTLVVSPTRLNYGQTETILELNIINTGGGTLSWNTSGDQNWIFISPTNLERVWVRELKGTTGPYETTTIWVRVVRANLMPGTNTANLLVNSNGGNKTVPISASVILIE